MQTTDHDRPGTGQATDERIPRRVSVPEAALLLGISEDAVRSRLRRRTLRKEKTPDGTVYVILNDSSAADRPPTSTDQPTTGQATDQPDAQAMLELMRDQVEMLRDQLDQERAANRENRRIIAALVQRVPELEARTPTESPRAEPHAPESAAEGTQTPETTASPEAVTERRSWWRRLFG